VQAPPSGWSASALPNSRGPVPSRFVFPLIAAVCSAFALAACNTASVNQPFETALINHRSTLMLDATPQQPLPEAEAKALVANLETRLLASPYIGKAMSREQFRQQFGGNFKLSDDYGLLSDTLSVVGLSDREQTARIGRLAQVEFLLGVQVFSVPCDSCTEGDQVGAVGQMFDARTGQLVWRVTLLTGVERNPASVSDGLHELSDKMVELFNDSLRPKWQRERFRNLNRKIAGQPRPNIPLQSEDHSTFHYEATTVGPSPDAP